ncbi:MAG TPA: hypothetical protein EYH05_01695 [Anaerolineae bacterium]|nr:hypothetical protein [Anaerolineae bacterium]
MLKAKSVSKKAPPPDGLVRLTLMIIKQAADDYQCGPQRNYGYYISACQFFNSAYYRMLLDFVATYLPDFEAFDGLYPAGVTQAGIERGVYLAGLPLNSAQGNFFEDGVPCGG